MDNIAYNIFVFSSFYISGSCDWIEISQASENVAPKSSSMTKHYAFPRNEFVYTRLHNNNNEKFLQSQYPSTTTAAIPLKKIVEATTEDTISIETKKSSMPYSNGASEIQKRMDGPEEMTPEKLVRTTEEATEETTDNWTSVEPEEETENFIPFLKKVQDEIIVKSNKNLKGKISMLKNLRDDLLLNIDERISHLWGGKTKRETEAREHKEDDYDMHFPSNEGALMTIGFLTFAVFLIKLVLKLVQALKDKHSMVMVTPTMMTTNTAAYIGRRKRDAVSNDHNRILQLIDEYSST